MAINQKNKVNNTADVDSKLGSNLLKAALYKISHTGVILTQQIAAFLLNPESWEESKSANWAAHNIPGQSDPLYQWVSSGPRTVSFDALITKDISNFEIKQQISKDSSQSSKTQILIKHAEQASKLAGFKIKNVPQSITDTAKTGRLDISAELNYYRSLLYPVYDDVNNPKRLIASPPLLALFSGSAINKIPYGENISANSDVWILTGLRIKHTKQLSNLAPMEATVSFQLTQYTIRSFSEHRFSGPNSR